VLERYLKRPNTRALFELWPLLTEQAAEIDRLLGALGEVRDGSRRAAIVLALGGARWRPDIREQLLFLLSDPDPVIRGAAAGALAGSATPPHEAVPGCGGLAVGTSPVTDRELLDRLSSAAGAEAVPAQVAFLMKLLGPSQSGDPRLGQWLLDLTRSEDPEVRRTAANMLTRFGKIDEESTMAMIGDPSLPLAFRASLVRSLYDRDPKAGPERLLQALEATEDIPIRVEVLGILARRASVASWERADAVLSAARHDEVRLAALEVIGAAAREDPNALARLERIGGEHESDEVRRRAIELGEQVQDRR
jgi:HEAT repeat protein